MFEFPEVSVSRYELIADELAERGWSVQDNLLPGPLVQALAEQCRRVKLANPHTKCQSPTHPAVDRIFEIVSDGF